MKDKKSISYKPTALTIYQSCKKDPLTRNGSITEVSLMNNSKKLCTNLIIKKKWWMYGLSLCPVAL